jgi:hypothetical protein
MRILLVILWLTIGVWAQAPTDLIPIQDQNLASSETVDSVRQALAWLPLSVQERLQKGGVSISLLPAPSEDNEVDGGSHYEPRQHRVVIGEPRSPVAKRRLPITALHELGHAYDWVLERYSQSAAFMECYNRELPQVRPQDKALLAHFLQPAPKGPAECFASLFACKYYPYGDRRLDALKANFPRTFELVRDLPG